MTNADWRIVPLDETRLAQWATLRQQLWPHHEMAAHLQEGAELLAAAHLNAFLVLDAQSQAVAFADAALRRDYVNGCAATFGQSITDACLSWSDTETLLAMLAEAAQVRLHKLG